MRREEKRKEERRARLSKDWMRTDLRVDPAIQHGPGVESSAAQVPPRGLTCVHTGIHEVYSGQLPRPQHLDGHGGEDFDNHKVAKVERHGRD